MLSLFFSFRQKRCEKPLDDSLGFLKMMRKNANAALAVLLAIVVIIILYAIIINAVKECRSDNDCGTERYCGSDFKCHEMKIVQKTIVQNEYGGWKAALILGAAIITAAIILRWKKNLI